jgi:hypothetical protein
MADAGKIGVIQREPELRLLAHDESKDGSQKRAGAEGGAVSARGLEPG